MARTLPDEGPAPRLENPHAAPSPNRMRVAINLLTEHPDAPSGAHWFWTRVIPEMAARCGSEEELHLIVSRRSRPRYEFDAPNVRYITFPWSNERRGLRTLSEHVYSPVRLPLDRIDVLNTLIAPVVNPTWSLVIHMKTMHAFTEPDAISPLVRTYRRFGYPRSARLADAIVINSESLRSEVTRYLDVDERKLRLIYEAVDHELFRPGDATAARAHVKQTYGVHRPFALFVSSLWRYKNCDGLLRAWAIAKPQLGDRQLVIVGPARDERYSAELHQLAADLGITRDVVWVGGVPLDETVRFYQAADVNVYPSHGESFGLPILEAMACACPVVTSNITAMPEIAGGAAALCDPADPRSIAQAIVDALESDRLRAAGLRRASQFTWAATGAATLDVYRDVAEQRRRRSAR
jgi:glycosyltransferase involved in cell wall biosynthesis